MSKDKTRPDDDVKSRRELLAATAKLSAFIGAVGLAGTGLAGEAAADIGTRKTPCPPPNGCRTAPTDSRSLKTAPMHKVQPRAATRLLPAVQKAQFRSLLQDAIRTGNARAALQRHPKLKLTPAQQKILIGLTPKDLATLRRYQSKLRGLKAPGMADDTGIIIY